MQDATRQGKILSFFFMKRKESCARKRGGGEKEGKGRKEGGGVKVFDLFQRYYKLSECSCFHSSYYYWMSHFYKYSAYIYSLFQIVYIARNPKDVSVSYYHFIRMLTYANYKGQFPDFFNSCINGRGNYDNEYLSAYQYQSLACLNPSH